MFRFFKNFPNPPPPKKATLKKVFPGYPTGFRKRWMPNWGLLIQ